MLPDRAPDADSRHTVCTAYTIRIPCQQAYDNKHGAKESSLELESLSQALFE